MGHRAGHGHGSVRACNQVFKSMQSDSWSDCEETGGCSHHAQFMARRLSGVQLLEHQAADALDRLSEEELDPGGVERDAGRVVP